MIAIEALEPVREGSHPSMPPSRPLALLFLGRLLAYKGLPFLREVLEPMRGRSDWHLTIAGEGPLAGWVLNAFADWPQVTLELGWVDEARFDALIDAHHLLLCPYTEASQSGVAARSLARGLPTIATPEGALPEQIRRLDPGLVADATTPEAFRRALTRILDDPNRIGRLSTKSLALTRSLRERAGWIDIVTSRPR